MIGIAPWILALSSGLGVVAAPSAPAPEDEVAADAEGTTRDNPPSASGPLTPVPWEAGDPAAVPFPGEAASPPQAAPGVGASTTVSDPAVDANGHALPPRPPVGENAEPPPPERPDRSIRWRLNFLGGASSTTIFNPSYRAFDEDRTLWAAGTGARFDIPVARGRIFLGAGLRWQRGRTSRGPILGGFDTELEVDEPEVNGRLSVVTIEGLDVFADLGGGPSIRRYQMHTSEQAASGQQVGGTAAAAGGASIYLPKRWLPRKGASRVTPGFELSLGYRYRSAVPIKFNVEGDDDPISVGATDLGDAKTSGLQFGVSVFLRLM